MRYLRFSCFAAIAMLSATQLPAQGLGTRIANLPVFNRDDNANSRSTSAPTSSQSSRSTTPTAPEQSELTFPRSSLAPQPSVTIPAATSPAGSLESASSNSGFQFGSRIRMAANAAREKLTIKPREIPANDPIHLSNMPDRVEAPVFVAAARVYEGQGRMDRAREQYEKALAVDSKSLEALIGFARLQHREGDLVAATELYQRALKAHPNNSVALNDLGLCYARRGMLPQAEQSLRQAVKKDGRSKLYRNNLALVLVETGRDDEALRHLNAVHGPAIAEYNLAYMLQEKGRPQDAARHLHAALKCDPQLEPARALLARLEPAGQIPTGGGLGRPQINQGRHATYGANNQWQPAVQPYREADPVHMRVEDSYSQQRPAPVYQGGDPSSQGELRRAPLPGDLPEYMRRDKTDGQPRSPWGD